jgi:hypothetical protein
VAGGVYSLGAGESQILTVRYMPTAVGTNNQTVTFTGGTGAAVSVAGIATGQLSAGADLVFQADSAVITAPFVLTNGFLSQSMQTVDPATGGRAVFSFTITNAGDYVVRASVNAPGDASNSLFLGIDAEPVAPAMIWDMPVPTPGFKYCYVYWRGNGTDLQPQFKPRVFSLSVGVHQLVIRGREANVQLRSIEIVKKSSLEIPPIPTGLIH